MASCPESDVHGSFEVYANHETTDYTCGLGMTKADTVHLDDCARTEHDGNHYHIYDCRTHDSDKWNWSRDSGPIFPAVICEYSVLK